MFFAGKSSKKCQKDTVQFQAFSSPSLQLQQFLEKFPLHCFQLFIPGTMKLPESIEEQLLPEQHQYILVRNITLVSLVNHSFIESFVKKGSLLGLSIDSEASIDNFIAVVPSGHLIASLKSQLQESLGLVIDRKDKHEQLSNKITSSVTIHLTEPCFKPTKKNYEKIVQEFKKLDDVQFNMIFSWVPHDSLTCPSSLQEYFKQQGFDCSTCEWEHIHDLKFAVEIPKINFSTTSGDPSCCSNWEFLEWIGTQACNIECKEEPDDYVNSYSIPEPFDVIGQMYRGLWRGLVTAQTLHKLLATVNQIFLQSNQIPFVTLLGYGFQDSYVLKDRRPVITSCDKNFSLVIFPDLQCWLYSYVGNKNF